MVPLKLKGAWHVFKSQKMENDDAANVGGPTTGRQVLASDFFGFNTPDGDSWQARVDKYVDIAGVPIVICRLIAEYGSTFFLTMTEPCTGCVLRDREMHGPFDIAGGLDAIINNSSPKTICGYSFMRNATYTMHNVNRNARGHIDLLTNGTWHRRLREIRPTRYMNTRSLSNPNGRPFRGPHCIPRDAYVIKDGTKVMENFEQCIDPHVITFHCALPMIGHLWFRHDIF